MSYIEEIRHFIAKEKTIYAALNCMRLQESLYYGVCWCPLDKEQQIMDKLSDIVRGQPHMASGQLQPTQPPTNLKPPTFIPTNDFTESFQEIVATYGQPSYGEVNPGFFTVVTFPFLFGVMYGDIGHSGLVFLFAWWLCRQNRDPIKARELSPFLIGLSKARYLLLLMSAFGIYSGFLYNEFFSLPLNLFGSCYFGKQTTDSKCVYPFGIDPGWYVSFNELNFTNSFRMKLAIIIGFVHMLLGVLLSSVNHFHFGTWLDFWCGFIPRLTFLLFTFGYLVIIIFVKWATDWNSPDQENDPPSLITTFIEMFFNRGEVSKPLWGDGTDQSSLERTMTALAFTAIFIMLLPKPVILLLRNLKKTKNKSSKGHFLLNQIELEEEKQAEPKPQPDDEEEVKDDETALADFGLMKKQKSDSHSTPNPEKFLVVDMAEHEAEFDISELLVENMIETIEFVLGTVSHTASYLRLWALALAHSQLSKVLFEKTIGDYIESGDFLGLTLGFFIFANMTYGILICMDILECCLHTLRLHWVEFQSKFYKADGYKFTPFSFKESLQDFIDRVH